MRHIVEGCENVVGFFKGLGSLIVVCYAKYMYVWLFAGW